MSTIEVTSRSSQHSRSSLHIPADIAAVLVDAAAYADGRIYPAYRWLRANNPLGIAEAEGFDPFWVVTRHADILNVSRQNDLFHSADRPTTLTNREDEARTRRATGSPNPLRSIVRMDAPDHPKYRVLTQAWFLPANLKRLEDRIREFARDSVAKLIERATAQGGRADFVEDLTLHYPLHVIMEILGVPRKDEPLMLRLTQQWYGEGDPDVGRKLDTPDSRQYATSREAVAADFRKYFQAITADRRAQPRDDLASVIANARIDGQLLSDVDLNGYYVIMATAGHDTTSSSSATALLALAQSPAELARVKADPSLIPGLVEEAVRWASPVKTFMRSATRDTELGGRHIAKGDWLMLCYGSGNRDEAVFEDPDVFRSDRNPNKHLSFGYGAHLCIGQYMAKMEMRILLEELLPRLEALELDGEPKWTHAWFVNGLKTLPLRCRFT
jgi:cytochrome P450